MQIRWHLVQNFFLFVHKIYIAVDVLFFSNNTHNSHPETRRARESKAHIRIHTHDFCQRTPDELTMARTNFFFEDAAKS